VTRLPPERAIGRTALPSARAARYRHDLARIAGTVRSHQRDIVDVMVTRRFTSAYRYARIVAERCGKGVAHQLAEIARIKRLNPTLGASDYYWYRLYDAPFIAETRIRDYLGWRVEDDVSQALNQRNLMLPAWDKFTLALFAKAYALPTPHLYAVFKPGPPLTSDLGAEGLTTPEALAAWLRNWRTWPIFAKPSCSRQSLGCYHFVGYDPADDSLILKGGAKVAVTGFVEEIVDDSTRPFYRAAMGYLFQEVLRPHPAIAQLLGSEAISGVRVVVLQDAQGSEVVAAVWKMTSGDNVLDAFGGRGSGTYLASVDCTTGRIGMAIDDWWPRGSEVQRIAATGNPIDGFVLPQWGAAVRLCLRAAAVFPLMRLQHWDIAITANGPRILEVNDFGALPVLQIFGRGLLTDRLRALLRASPAADRLPWIARVCG
jgi:hypothetical protein